MCNKEYDKTTNSYSFVVSHGIDAETLETVVLPQVNPVDLGAVMDYTIGEFILP